MRVLTSLYGTVTQSTYVAVLSEDRSKQNSRENAQRLLLNRKYASEHGNAAAVKKFFKLKIQWLTNKNHINLLRGQIFSNRINFSHTHTHTHTHNCTFTVYVAVPGRNWTLFCLSQKWVNGTYQGLEASPTSCASASTFVDSTSSSPAKVLWPQVLHRIHTW